VLAIRGSILQSVAVYCIVLQHSNSRTGSMLQRVTVYCSALLHSTVAPVLTFSTEVSTTVIFSSVCVSVLTLINDQGPKFQN